MNIRFLYEAFPLHVKHYKCASDAEQDTWAPVRDSTGHLPNVLLLSANWEVRNKRGP
jgi:hypothetical protein